jgi:hypothetical protein
MVIKSSGTLGLSSDIKEEFGGDTPHNISEYYRLGGRVPAAIENLKIPTAGRILFSAFYGAVNSSFKITPSVTTTGENAAITFSVVTAGLADGTALFWSTTGSANADDFADNTLVGSVSINDNNGSIVREVRLDVTTEGDESFNINLRTGSQSGPIVATSATVTILDTSITSATKPNIVFNATPTTIISGASTSLSWAVTGDPTAARIIGLAEIGAVGFVDVFPTFTGTLPTEYPNNVNPQIKSYELYAERTVVSNTSSGTVTDVASRSAHVYISVLPPIPSSYVVFYRIVGAGGGGGAGREDDAGRDRGRYLGQAPSSFINVNAVRIVTADSGLGGISFSRPWYDTSGSAGAGGWPGTPGGQISALNTAGFPAPPNAYGAGGGGGGGDKDSNGLFGDSSGNRGDGGAGGQFKTGTFVVNVGDTIQIGLSAGQLGHSFDYSGGQGGPGYAELSFNNQAYSFQNFGAGEGTIFIDAFGQGSVYQGSVL